MLLFWKLIDETQMAASREYTDAFIITKKLFLGGLRGLQSNSIRYERPCKYMFNLFSSDCMFCTLVIWFPCNTSVFKTIYFWAPINSIIHFYGSKSNKPFKLCVQFEQDHKKVQNHLPSEELWRIFRLKNNNLGTKMQCNLEKYHPSCTRYPLGWDLKVL